MYVYIWVDWTDCASLTSLGLVFSSKKRKNILIFGSARACVCLRTLFVCLIALRGCEEARMSAGSASTSMAMVPIGESKSPVLRFACVRFDLREITSLNAHWAKNCPVEGHDTKSFVERLTVDVHRHYLAPCRLRLQPLCVLYPNVQSLSLRTLHVDTSGVHFRDLVSLRLSDDYGLVVDAGIVRELLTTHSVQTLKLGIVKKDGIDKNLLSQLDRVPSLDVTARSQDDWMPLGPTPSRVALSIDVTEEMFGCWCAQLRGIPSQFCVSNLHTLEISMNEPGRITPADVETNWSDLELVLHGALRSLNTLNIADMYSSFGAIQAARVARLLAPTHVTSLSIMCLAFDGPFQQIFPRSLPRLCEFHVAQERTDWQVERHSFKAASVACDVWACHSISLAFFRANKANPLALSYVPLVPGIAKLAGQSNAHGALACYSQKQQKFREKLHSLAYPL